MALRVFTPARRFGPVEIGLSTFIRFDTADGHKRIAAVEERQAGEWSRITDFYLPLRHLLRRRAAAGSIEPSAIQVLADNQEDKRRRDRYSLLARGFAAFQKRYRPRVVGKVPAASWQDMNIRVTVDPEVIFGIGRERFITKIYLPKDRLAANRLTPSLQLLREAYQTPRYRVAILDCERGLLYRDGRLDRRRSGVLLRVTAAQFVGIWRLLESGERPTHGTETG